VGWETSGRLPGSPEPGRTQGIRSRRTGAIMVRLRSALDGSPRLIPTGDQSVRAEIASRSGDRGRAAARAARVAGYFLHAEFYGLGGIRRHVANRRRNARSGTARRSVAAGRCDGRVVDETRQGRGEGGADRDSRREMRQRRQGNKETRKQGNKETRKD
jgi:hypothetical protein